MEFVEMAAQNGLGFASFIALMIFIFKYQAKSNDTLDEISKTLIQLVERVDKIEDKLDKKEDKE